MSTTAELTTVIMEQAAEIARLRAGFGPGLIQELRDKIERLRVGLRRLSEQDYDAGYSPEDYARAVLDGHEPEERPPGPASPDDLTDPFQHQKS